MSDPDAFGDPTSHSNQLLPDGRQPIAPQTLIDKASLRVVYDLIEGDYLEFGVFRGRSFINAWKALSRSFNKRLTIEAPNMNAAQLAHATEIWKKFRFIAFDSFQGLPKIRGVDLEGNDFLEGQFSCSRDNFMENLTTAGVDISRVETVEGWYNETCTTATKDALNLRRASIIWIDCDLYESTKDVLNFVKDILSDGTLLIFDDWFCFRGSPFLGQQRAFGEFREAMPNWVFNEFSREASTRVAFFCNKIP